MKQLSNLSLTDRHPEVLVPQYDRTKVTPGIFHLGIGAFHRAHQAVYIDGCLADGERNWGIKAASLRSAETRDKLKTQDWLYSVATKDSEESNVRVIGSITDILVAKDSPQKLIEALTDPNIKIVTLTVTEKGYGVNMGDRTLRLNDADISHDLDSPANPRSTLGFLMEAIDRRAKARTTPFTLLSCDNQPSNGKTLKLALSLMSKQQNRGLETFIENEIACPSCMVDRIVPATTEEDTVSISSRVGLSDAWPVVGERYSQWVIEENFPGGRPQLENHGVQFVKDVSVYETMKLRMLNGAHTAIAAIGLLTGKRYVSEVVQTLEMRHFLMEYWLETSRSLSVDKDEISNYAVSLLKRFQNTEINHRLDQIATDASQKVPQRLLRSMLELQSEKKPYGRIAFAVAAWMCSCDGKNDSSGTFVVNDSVFHAQTMRAESQLPPGALVDSFFNRRDIFPDNFTDAQVPFRSEIASLVSSIRNRGTMGALQELQANR